jgi:hypothetical protein
MSAGYTPLQIQAEAQRRKRERRVIAQSTTNAPPAPPVWTPQPGPQQQAYESDADEIGYGGAAGGGKSDLMLGFAGTKHKRSTIYRRVFPSLDGMIERSREIYNQGQATHANDRFNESLHRWRWSDGRIVAFRAVQYETDLKKYQGKPNDFLGFDEATEFPEFFVRFLCGWNRSADAGQKCRIVLAFNPPMDDSGQWVISYFAPWLSDTYPDPAVDGEIRLVVRLDDKDTFYRQYEDIPEETQLRLAEDAVAQGLSSWRQLVKRRTFFHASLKDNPILAVTGYGATIEALPEPLRSFLKGKFSAGKVEDPWQLIPTAWVRAAEARHAARPVPNTPLSAVGADIARGGKDRMSIAKLYDTWLAPIETHPGVSVTNGPKGAALLLPYAGVPLGVDVISIGSSVYDSLQANDVPVAGINFGAGAPEFLRTRNGNLKFKNIRAAAYWKLREALDPAHGDDLALPDDPELREELCAPRFEVTAQGIQIEPKDAIKQRLGRSPDKADAVALAYYTLIAQPPESSPAATSYSVRTW